MWIYFIIVSLYFLKETRVHNQCLSSACLVFKCLETQMFSKVFTSSFSRFTGLIKCRLTHSCSEYTFSYSSHWPGVFALFKNKSPVNCREPYTETRAQRCGSVKLNCSYIVENVVSVCFHLISAHFHLHLIIWYPHISTADALRTYYKYCPCQISVLRDSATGSDFASKTLQLMLKLSNCTNPILQRKMNSLTEQRRSRTWVSTWNHILRQIQFHPSCLKNRTRNTHQEKFSYVSNVRK